VEEGDPIHVEGNYPNAILGSKQRRQKNHTKRRKRARSRILVELKLGDDLGKGKKKRTTNGNSGLNNRHKSGNARKNDYKKMLHKSRRQEVETPGGKRVEEDLLALGGKIRRSVARGGKRRKLHIMNRGENELTRHEVPVRRWPHP